MIKNSDGQSNDSKRSFVSNGALATTATALGAGALAGAAVAQNEDEVVVFGDDFQPDVDFDVVSQLSSSAKLDIIEASGSADDVFDDPDDWDVFIINHDLGSDAPTWGLLFTEDLDLSAGDSETMGEDGDIRDPELHLMRIVM
ncbi:hypothetical protein [Natronorubrum bangense]|uniref:Calcium-binding outer membrane-like protein n=2 Tax=Natronorubrum bangense TaxID=61858 RepID=L9WN33_9EURY|nr:hypothetical protein [Natronorubrum bangense]ELY49753.1 calcium-binding outer membrane-like protein [Natronorubrum bangense JCM 10635]QCC55382.1 calcium-binding protein [Natronorubrum bangense]